MNARTSQRPPPFQPPLGAGRGRVVAAAPWAAAVSCGGSCRPRPPLKAPRTRRGPKGHAADTARGPTGAPACTGVSGSVGPQGRRCLLRGLMPPAPPSPAITCAARWRRATAAGAHFLAPPLAYARPAAALCCRFHGNRLRFFGSRGARLLLSVVFSLRHPALFLRGPLADGYGGGGALSRAPTRLRAARRYLCAPNNLHYGK